MPTTFAYKVRDRSGQLIRGKIEAENPSLVAGKLRELGYAPIEIKAESALDLHRDIEIPGLSRVKLKDIAIMSRQLATMVNSGLTLVRALAVLGEQIESSKLRSAVSAVRADVERGSSLSQAMEKQPDIFDPLYVAMIRAGEAGGQLDHVLARLATTIEKQVELRGKVKSAMYYPVIVLSVVVLIVTLMMIIVVPTFKNLYATLHGTLPLPTRIVISISGIVASWRLILVIILFGLLVFAFRRWVATESGRTTWDRFKMRPPIAGPLVHKIALSRLVTTLSSLLNSGVGIIEALEMSAANVGNKIVANAARSAEAGVREGRSLAASLAAHEVIPTMVTQMIETGEESGALDEMLERVGQFYDNEVNATVSGLTTLLEPVMIVVMGAIIGAIVISLYLPMLKYVTLINTSGTS
ncbi:MAG TPA: type II secretion system F family protein [Acidimicrobiales bacterium]|nr:type II secretion system F family protein [Acidimicrobiales bacterium]